MKVISIIRPKTWTLEYDSTVAFDSTTFHDSTAGEPSWPLIPVEGYSSGLIISFDVYEDGSLVTHKAIRFRDYTGLETEYADGTSVTVLDAAIQTVTNGYTNAKFEEDSTNPEIPNTYQRGQLMTRSYTKSLS